MRQAICGAASLAETCAESCHHTLIVAVETDARGEDDVLHVLHHLYDSQVYCNSLR